LWASIEESKVDEKIVFYKMLIQLSIEKACFDQSFFKTRFF
jgi:hypothetical protein